jgi:hypothetical protein
MVEQKCKNKIQEGVLGKWGVDSTNNVHSKLASGGNGYEENYA